MLIKERIEKELESYSCDFDYRIATVGTTARESQPFAVLPRRKALGFEAINFLVVNPDYAEECFKLLDGAVKFILVDIELKKKIDLMQIAKRTVKKASLISYKPNDTTLEAADMFLRHYFNDELKGKKIFIYGAGNLGSKLSLRLAERGADVFLDSRNKKKTAEIIEVLNYFIPQYSCSSIKSIDNYENFNDKMDVFIAFTSASNVIPSSYLQFIKNEGLALDGGINNFTSDFIKGANEHSISCYRLDVRAAFPHTILFLIDYISNFYHKIQGEMVFDKVRVVAGGIIGNEGDIVVDRIHKPKQIVGIANGIGGLKLESEYTSNERQNIIKLKGLLSRN